MKSRSRRRRNPAISAVLTRVFDMPGKLLKKTPIIKRTKLPGYVAPMLWSGLSAAGVIALAAVGLKAVDRIEDRAPALASFYKAGAGSISGIVGSLLIGFAPSKVLSPAAKGKLVVGMLGGGVAIDVFRHVVLQRSVDADLEGLALEDMGAPGPAYDIIPASAADPYHGLAVQEYQDAQLVDAMGCHGGMSPNELHGAMSGFADWFQRFGQSPRRTTSAVGQGSRHAGREGHRWGWLIKAIGPAQFKALAALDSESRDEAIAEIKAAALAQAQQSLSGLAISDMQGLAIDSSMQGLAIDNSYGNAMVAGAAF